MDELKIDNCRYLKLSIDDRKKEIQQQLVDLFRIGGYVMGGYHMKRVDIAGTQFRPYEILDLDLELSKMDRMLRTYRNEIQHLINERKKNNE